MLTFVLCIALIDLGIGYYLGIWLLVRAQPLPALLENGPAIPALAEQPTPSDDNHQSSLQAELPDQPSDVPKSAAGQLGTPPKAGWKASNNDLKNDIATITERIRYAYSANDKQLAKNVAAELRTRTKLWTTQLQELLTELNAELELDPAAKIDCVTPELCLAQIETLQTNLELLDWSDSTEIILKKLEHEVEAVKKLLPANSKAS